MRELTKELKPNSRLIIALPGTPAATCRKKDRRRAARATLLHDLLHSKPEQGPVAMIVVPNNSTSLAHTEIQ
eukprot:5699974-Amphidinium_carterae.1